MALAAIEVERKMRRLVPMVKGLLPTCSGATEARRLLTVCVSVSVPIKGADTDATGFPDIPTPCVGVADEIDAETDAGRVVSTYLPLRKFGAPLVMRHMRFSIIDRYRTG